jgi:hypothetical protein
MTDSNGTQSQEGESRARPYVVLEQSSLLDAVTVLFKSAEVGLGPEEWDRVKQAAALSEGLIYAEVARLPSRNGAHALTQVGRNYDTGVTPPLVAVSERMFRPRTVKVDPGEPRVTVS